MKLNNRLSVVSDAIGVYHPKCGKMDEDLQVALAKFE